MRSPIRKQLIALWLAAGLLLANSGVDAQTNGILFDDVLTMLGEKADGAAILKKIPTVFTLDAAQVEQLRRAGASQALVQKLQEPRLNLADLRNVLLIVDCSGSMSEKMPDGRSRMEAAKEAVLSLLDSIPESRNVGLIIYGHDEKLECDAVKVAMPIRPFNAEARAELQSIVRGLHPAGHTPIGNALRLAALQLTRTQGLSQFVLLTDGVETCSGNPAFEAELIVKDKEHPVRSVDVVALGLSPKEQASVAEISRRGLGKFVAADNSKELVRGLQVAAGVDRPQAEARGITPKSSSKASADSSKPATLAIGEYGQGRIGGKNHYWRVDLPAGKYSVILDGICLNENHSKIMLIRLERQVLNDSLVSISEANTKRFRRVSTIRIDRPTKETLVMSSTGDLCEYAFAIVPADDEFSVPYFVDTPSIGEIEIGKVYSYETTGNETEDFFRVTFPEGTDYRIKVKFEPLYSKRAQFGGYFGLIDTNGDGVTKAEVGSLAVASSVSREMKLRLADEANFIARMRYASTEPQRVTFSIHRWAE